MERVAGFWFHSRSPTNTNMGICVLHIANWHFDGALTVQGHLEKLASNAKSIHHVLEALCGGLDRLEKKMDTNSSQVYSLDYV